MTTRERLPARRRNESFKVRLGGHALHITVGMYADGRIAEVFVDTHKDGTALRALCHAFAITLSIGLQHGVPVETFASALTGLAGEPSGDVDWFDGIVSAKSIPDLVVRVLRIVGNEKETRV